MYTSGTTARPEGRDDHARQPRLRSASAQVAELAWPGGPRARIAGRSTTSARSTWCPPRCSTSALRSGIVRRFDPRDGPRRDRGATAVDRLARAGDGQAVIDDAALGGARPDSSMRVIIDGGEKMPLPLIERVLTRVPERLVRRRLRADRDGQRRHLPRTRARIDKLGSVGKPVLQRRPARRRRRTTDAAARRGGRGRHARPEGAASGTGGDPEATAKTLPRTAGSTPATSAVSTRTATCTSSTGSRT